MCATDVRNDWMYAQQSSQGRLGYSERIVAGMTELVPTRRL